MSIQTTYSQARQTLADLCNLAAEDHEIIIIKRRKAGSVALICAEELSSLLETAHLLRSPKNAERLMKAYFRAKSKSGRPQTAAALREELGLE
jgi:antitoxin YefM